MSDTECPRCGAAMKAGEVCPVCEIPHHADDGRAPAAVEPPAATALGRLAQSGRLAVALAAVCFLAALVVPLLVDVRPVSGLGSRVSATPLQMISAAGPYGRTLRSTVLVAVPGAALALLQFLWTRRTRKTMLATRPLLLVVALLPALAAVMPVLKLEKHDRFAYGLGPAMGLIAAGVVAGLVGAAQFGRGVPERPLRRDDEDDED